MTVNVSNLFLVIFSFVISLIIVSKIKYNYLKILGVCFEVGFFIYSGIGMAFFNIDRIDLFIFQYMFSAFLFSITVYIQSSSYKKYITINHNLDERVFFYNNGLLPKIFTAIYIFTFVFPFLYPKLDILRILDIRVFFNNYHALTSSYKLQLQNDSIYQFVCTTLRTLSLPWFYIYLYRIRNNSVKFIIIYIIPIYLYAVNFSYISRNEIAVYFVFLYIYMYSENVLSKRVLRIVAIVAVPLIILLFARIFYLREGISSYSLNSSTLFQDLFSKETNFVNNYQRASYLNNSFSTIMFFIYVSTCFIPLSVRSVFGIYEINMARILSNDILNMNYGDRDYYLILPSVLGEGIMVFNEYFAWVYLIIISLFLCYFLKIINRNDSAKYLTIYYIIDVFRQLRGGSQFIISSWIASIIPFTIICYLTRQFVIEKRSVK